MINVPELILFDSLKKVLKAIRTDYAAKSASPSETILYKILHGNEVQRYKLFDQAKAVFITDENNPRHLDINLFFNAKRAPIPTIHITLPSEMEKNNVLGIGEGFHEPLYSEIEQTYQRTFNRRFNSKYSLIVTSDNTNEVILIYHFLRSVLVSLTEHLSLSGLENLKLSGGDIQISSEIVPNNIFIRSIGLDFEYDVEGIDLIDKDVFDFNVLAESTIVVPD